MMKNEINSNATPMDQLSVLGTVVSGSSGIGYSNTGGFHDIGSGIIHNNNSIKSNCSNWLESAIRTEELRNIIQNKIDSHEDLLAAIDTLILDRITDLMGENLDTFLATLIEHKATLKSLDLIKAMDEELRDLKEEINELRRQVIELNNKTVQQQPYYNNNNTSVPPHQYGEYEITRFRVGDTISTPGLDYGIYGNKSTV